MSTGLIAYVDNVFGDDNTAALQDLNQPFKSIQSAVNAVSGSIGLGQRWQIEIRPGNYGEDVVIPQSPTGASIDLFGLSLPIVSSITINGASVIQGMLVLANNKPGLVVDVVGQNIQFVLSNALTSYDENFTEEVAVGVDVVNGTATFSRCGNFLTIQESASGIKEAYLARVSAGGELNAQLNQDEFQIRGPVLEKAVMYQIKDAGSQLQLSHGVSKMTPTDQSALNILLEAGGLEDGGILVSSHRLGSIQTNSEIPLINQTELIRAKGNSKVDLTLTRLEFEGQPEGTLVSSRGIPDETGKPIVRILENAFVSSLFGLVRGEHQEISWNISDKNGSTNMSGGLSDILKKISADYQIRDDDRSLLVVKPHRTLTLPDPKIRSQITTLKGQDLIIKNESCGSIYIRGKIACGKLKLRPGKGVLLKNDEKFWYRML